MTTEPARRIEYLPVDDLIPARTNPKRHRTDLLRQSIARFGYASPALRDERTGRLVVGHGRTTAVIAMREAGESAPDGVRVDAAGRWLVPVVCGWSSRSDAEAEALLLADNRHTELGGWDTNELAEMLGDVAGTDADLAELAGWTPGELEDLLSASEAGPLVEHATPPATAADYGESPEQMAERAERINAYEKRSGGDTGYSEMVLVYTEDDRAEVVRLLTACRAKLRSDMRASEVMLCGLRALAGTLSIGPDELEPAEFSDDLDAEVVA